VILLFSPPLSFLPVSSFSSFLFLLLCFSLLDTVCAMAAVDCFAGMYEEELRATAGFGVKTLSGVFGMCCGRGTPFAKQ
jgi:hypothetical protein